MSRRRKKPPAEPVLARIESLSHDGRGVARLDGKVIFIDGALPDETVMFRYTSQRRRNDEGRVLELITASPERVKPRCAHFDQCGGCSLQHLQPEAQIGAKQQMLAEQLRRIGKVEAEQILPPLTGPRWGYRHKARLGVRFVEAKGRVLVGFREKRSGFVVDMERCEVLHPTIGERILDIAELVQSLQACRRIPQVEIAVGGTAAALIFRHLEPLSDEDCTRLITFGEQTGLHLYLQPRGPDTAHLLWPEQSQLSYRLPDFDLELRFSPTDFTQVNSELNNDMVRQAVTLLKPRPNDRVLDLFCGIGNFSLPLARLAGEVIGVEGEAKLVQRARENALHNGLNNALFHVADLAEKITSTGWQAGAFDKILLDPPRSGALEILPWMAALGAGRIVYVSCNPSTLARDAGELVNVHGYRLISAGVMDMFPHTAHVESIALFQR